MYLTHKKEKGFTLIELIISIFILSVAIVGIFNAFSIITILTSDTVDQLTATYLAQEGMEIARNIRDTNWLNMDAGSPANATWVDGLNSCTAGCEADYTTTGKATNPMSSGSSRYLKINPPPGGNNFYNYTSGTDTKFKRKITITPILDFDNNSSNQHILKVIAQVSWNKKATILNSGISADTCSASNCVTAEETLYNWYNTNIPSNIATVTSLTYTVSTGGVGTETITNVPSGTPKTAFENALVRGQVNQTWDDTDLSDPVLTGDTLVVTAQDGTTKTTYTIAVNTTP